MTPPASFEGESLLPLLSQPAAPDRPSFAALTTRLYPDSTLQVSVSDGAWTLARDEQGVESLEVSEEAENEWVERVLQLAGGRGEFMESCTPSYYNNEGKPGPASRQNGFFFGEPGEFMQILEDCRADGGMKGLEVRYGESRK